MRLRTGIINQYQYSWPEENFKAKGKQNQGRVTCHALIVSVVGLGNSLSNRCVWSFYLWILNGL